MADNNEADVADYQDGEADEVYGTEEQNPEEVNAAEPDKFKQRVLEMEEELEKLTQMEQQVEKQITSASDKLDECSMWVSYVFLDFLLLSDHALLFCSDMLVKLTMRPPQKN